MSAEPSGTHEDDCEAEGPAIQIGEMGRSLGLLLSVAHFACRERQYAVIEGKEGRVKVGEFSILQAIGENPGVRQGTLADMYRIKWPSMSKLIASMEKRGLLQRVVPPKDRRAIGLELTKEGHAQVARQFALMREVNSSAFTMLSDEEQETLVGLLRKVANWENV